MLGLYHGVFFFPQCQSTLLVFCRSGHVVEVQHPESVTQNTAKTYRLSGLPTRTFHFRSIKSRIKVDFSINLTIRHMPLHPTVTLIRPAADTVH